ncbi:MAG: RidA family protein [Cyclobacteriaceae bacterium]|nr:RidA family protein [Cyclobacteriaceae bacterium]
MDSLSPEQRLEKLKLELPPAPEPMGVYRPFLIVGNLAYVSGHGPFTTSGNLIKGRIGADIDMDAGKAAAKQVGLSILSTLRHNLGTLNRIKRVIKVLGMVNAAENFQKHPYVINGCSELFAEVFGEENGIGVRSAVGMGSLPDNIPVEIEAVFELV